MAKKHLLLLLPICLVLASCGWQEDKYVTHCKAVSSLDDKMYPDTVALNIKYDHLLVYSPKRHPDKIFVQFTRTEDDVTASEFGPWDKHFVRQGRYRCGYEKRADKDWAPQDLELFFFDSQYREKYALQDDFTVENPSLPSEDTKKRLAEMSAKTRALILSQQ